MRVYIDLANFISFLSARKDEKWDNCKRMLEKQCDIRLNFKKSEIAALANNPSKREHYEIIMAFVRLLGDNKWENWHKLEESDSVFPKRPLQNDIYNSNDKEHLLSVYLLNDEKVKYLQDDGCLLIASLGEEINTLALLNMGDDDWDYDISFDIRKELNDWSDINSYLSPCTDIIFADRFIFCAAEEETLDNNIYSLIAQLSSRAKRRKINICFITEDIKRYGLDWQNIINKTKHIVEKKTRAKPNVTIIALPEKGGFPKEHDRTIFTNYRYITFGDTPTYFGSTKDEDGRTTIITNGRNFSIKSLAKKRNTQLSQSFIDDIQCLINEINRKNRSDLVIGDKQSNFLYF